MRLTYLVLPCHNLAATRRFYELLGLTFAEEKHGDGPTHFSVDVAGVVIELYPRRGEDREAVPRRLGLAVPDPAGTVAALRAAGFEPLLSVSVPSAERHCLLDPDGRTVELSAEDSRPSP